MKPPGVKDNWSDCNVSVKANMIAYSQIRDIETVESSAKMLKALFG